MFPKKLGSLGLKANSTKTNDSQSFQRLVEDLDVTLTHRGKIAELIGLYYLYDPYDLCLEGPRQQDGPLAVEWHAAYPCHVKGTDFSSTYVN